MKNTITHVEPREGRRRSGVGGNRTQTKMLQEQNWKKSRRGGGAAVGQGRTSKTHTHQEERGALKTRAGRSAGRLLTYQANYLRSVARTKACTCETGYQHHGSAAARVAPYRGRQKDAKTLQRAAPRPRGGARATEDEGRKRELT